MGGIPCAKVLLCAQGVAAKMNAITAFAQGNVSLSYKRIDEIWEKLAAMEKEADDMAREIGGIGDYGKAKE